MFCQLTARSLAMELGTKLIILQKLALEVERSAEETEFFDFFYFLKKVVWKLVVLPNEIFKD